mgnify:CR=1 FL=1
MAKLNFNANEVEPAGSFEPLPAGEYICVITDSDMVPTKSGEGQFLKLDLQVVDGEFKNRKLFDRLNLKNKNTKTVEIAQKVLSSICRSVGVMVPRDSSELHDKPLMVKVSVDMMNRYEGDDMKQNTIRGYFPADGSKLNTTTVNQATVSSPSPSPGPVQMGAPSPVNGKGGVPWQK